MLKKTGIIVATAATGLLALTPFAFADSGWNHDTSIKYKSDSSVDRDQHNKCAFGQSQGVDSLFDQLPLIGELPPVPPAPPAPAGSVVQTQTQAGNCTNVGDAAPGLVP